MSDLKLTLHGKEVQNYESQQSSVDTSLNDEVTGKNFQQFSNKLKKTEVYKKISEKAKSIAAKEDHEDIKQELRTMILDFFDTDDDGLQRVIDPLTRKEYLQLTYGGETLAIMLSAGMGEQFADYFVKTLMNEVNQNCESQDVEHDTHEDLSMTYDLIVADIQPTTVVQNTPGVGPVAPKKKGFWGSVTGRISDRINSIVGASNEEEATAALEETAEDVRGKISVVKKILGLFSGGLAGGALGSMVSEFKSLQASLSPKKEEENPTDLSTDEQQELATLDPGTDPNSPGDTGSGSNPDRYEKRAKEYPAGAGRYPTADEEDI